MKGTTFEEREDRRWERWWHRTAKRRVAAQRRRVSTAAGSVSAWVKPIRSARPVTPSPLPLSALRAELEAAAAKHTASFSRNDELARLIAEQATEMLCESPAVGRAQPYVHTDDEPRELGLTPWGDLDDGQQWVCHALNTDPKAFAEYQDRGRLGFVPWAA